MNASNPPSFTSLLAQPTLAPAQAVERRRLVGAAGLALLAAIVVGAAWTALAPLAGAVVAPAQVKVDMNRRTVQHQEGGIVREILVRDGQRVRAGEPLVVVGNVRSDAELALLRSQRLAERLRLARAAAEATLAPQFAVPAELARDTGAAEPLARQQALFAARRRTLDEQVLTLRAQMRDADAQVAAVAGQIDATERSSQLAAEELAINEKLVQQGFITRARLLGLQREASDYRGRVGEQRSELALARQRRGDVAARIAQAHNLYQTQAADEMREATARLGEIDERLRTSQDQSDRQVVRAPVDGEVMAVRVSAPGQAIGPREPIADVVPSHEPLLVEARIRPQDIDQVHTGSAAEVRIDAFDARSTALLPARVSFVSGDRVTSADGREAWFVATVEVDAAALKRHAVGPLRPGMPAELFVATEARTLLEYLAKPLGGFTQRAMRER